MYLFYFEVNQRIFQWALTFDTFILFFQCFIFAIIVTYTDGILTFFNADRSFLS